MSRLRAAFHSPTAVFEAQVDMASIEYPLDELTYDGVTTGAYTNIKPGQTVIFGSAPGGDDLGRQRIRKAADASKIYIGRSSANVHDGEINVADNSYITVLDDHRVWSKTPYIDDEGNVLKDSETGFQAYSPPVANVGPAMAGDIDSGTSKLRVTLPPDSNTSWATQSGASISTFGWDLPSGVTLVDGYTLADSQIEVDCDAGWHWVACTVTDSNGLAHHAWVPIYARDPANDTSIPVEIVGHRIRAMGQEVSLRVLESLPTQTFPDGTSVIVWEGQPADGTDRSHILFHGWHDTDDQSALSERNAVLRDTVLHCVDVAGRLDKLAGFPQEIMHSDNPAVWTEMDSPDVRRYIHYLLLWHSTALELADFTLPADLGNYPFVILESNGESLYDQVRNLCSALRPDRVFTCNRLGQLSVAVDPMLQAPADRTSTVQTTLDGGDIAELRYSGQRPPRLHWRRGWAIIADEEEANNIVHCVAPGEAPGQGPDSQEEPRGLTLSQTDLNATEGNRYARANARHGIFNIRLTGSSLRGLEPADLTWVQLQLASDWATQRGVPFTTARGLVHEINVTYEHTRSGPLKNVEVLWEREVVGPAAVTVIPPVGDPDDDDWGDWEELPQQPPPPLGGSIQNMVAVNADGYQYVTNNFHVANYQGGPSWSRDNLGLSGDILSFTVDPFSPLYMGSGTTVNYWVATTTNIYYVEDAFGVSGGPTVTNQHTFANSTDGPTLRNGNTRTIGASFGNFFSGDALVVCISNYRSAAGHTGVWATYSQDGGQTWSSEVQISSHYDNSGNYWRTCGLYVSPKTAGLVRTSAPTVTQQNPPWAFYESSDYGATWALQTGPKPDPGQGGGALHVPWPDNATETITYHNHLDVVGGAMTLKRVNADGSVSDVSPTDDSGRTYGSVYHSAFGVKTYDSDRRYVVVAGFEYGGNLAVFVSDDYGDSWTTIISPSSSDPVVLAAAFGQDSPQILYLWGTSGYIAFSGNFGATIDDRRGNIPTDFPSAGVFVGIAGGG